MNRKLLFVALYLILCLLWVPTSFGLEDEDVIYERVVREIRSKRALSIYPGTKWCGAGSEAFNETDLGPKAETDKCCRSHDTCEHSIPSREEKYGVKNDGFFTVSLCDCDHEFSNCLRNNKELASRVIDRLYRTILAAPCFILKEGKAIWNETSFKASKISIFRTEMTVKNFIDNAISTVSDLIKGTREKIASGLQRLYDWIRPWKS